MVRDGQAPIQLTRTTKGSSSSAAFTPMENTSVSWPTVAIKHNSSSSPCWGGEAIQVTRDEDGISSYDWSPDGKRIVYSKPLADSKTEKNTKDRFGSFGVEGEEYKLNHLWLLNFHYDSVFMAGQLPCTRSKKILQLWRKRRHQIV